ncbi:MAG: DUF4340 domain-containing protein [Anaerolineales bacterium]|nr:DUF4340 domain-containing protein [Anaerolineales bacterium]MCX7754099.1 DUF4340 domain-containing protein [Anaerolineales bacterium]MDW8278818.1 DUF4340 domain-containing protein [Anaerolineales bacterium]
MRRSTVVMLLLLVVVAALYWYMQQPENVIERVLQPTPTATKADLGYIIAPEKGQPTRIVIEPAQGSPITLDKTSGIWLLTTPEKNGPADPNSVDLAATGLTALRILSKIEPAPPLSQIGLEPPAYRVSVTMSDGSKVDFHVGAKTVTQSGYYIRTADGNLVVTAAYNIDSLLKLAGEPPFLQTATPTPDSTPQATPTP